MNHILLSRNGPTRARNFIAGIAVDPPCKIILL